MARSDAEKREKIFGVLALNLNAMIPEVKDTVVCPLCHSSHGRESLLGVDPELTLEHCIPKSAGEKSGEKSGVSSSFRARMMN